MKESLYRVLPTCADEEGGVSFDARSCWSILVQIDAANMAAFIAEHEPSIELCYAIGCLEFAYVSEEYTTPLYNIIPDLIEQAERSEGESQPEFINALLFASSHCPTFLAKNRPILEKVVEFIIEAHQCYGSKVSQAATNALLYILMKLSTELLDGKMELATSNH